MLKSTAAGAAFFMGISCTQQTQAEPAWTYFTMQNGVYGWNSGAIERDAEGRVITRIFMLFAESQPIDASEYIWRMEKLRFDCPAQTIEFLEGSFLDKDRKELGTAIPEPPVSIRAGSPDEASYRIACENHAFANQQTAPDLSSAMDGATTLLQSAPRT